MKARNRKTGETVDIICYSKCSPMKRSPIDWVSYIDSHGVEHSGSFHYYFDFEPIEDIQDHWQDVKERAAIAALQGLLANPALVHDDGDCSEKVFIIARAMRYADDIVEKLKEK